MKRIPMFLITLLPIRNLNGAIDEFAIYSAVLSGEEIQSLYRSGQP